MAVMLVIGSIDRLPQPIYNVLSSGQTITSKLGREIGESAFGSTHFSVLVFMSLILVTLSLVLTILSQRLLQADKRHA
jgi:ABC-type phosphate transport system permease subunit